MREHPQTAVADDGTTAAVLAIVADVARRVHPSAECPPEPSPVSCLERDLGFDSLVRLELLSRLRTRFGEGVDAESVVAADSVGDIVRALGGRGSGPLGAAGTELGAPPVGIGRTPSRTVPEILTRLAEADPDFACVSLLDGAGGRRELRAGSLLTGARRVAAGLGRRIDPGEPVALMLPTGREFVEAFFGIQLAGGVPVPLAPAPRPSQLEDHLARQVGILRHCGAGMLVVAPEVARLARLARLRAETVRRVLVVDELTGDGPAAIPWRARPEDPALLQYTSGSTGSPKGVVLSHANVLANLSAIAGGLATSSDDVFVSWLPLYHDMGLIGGLLHPLHTGIPLVLMTPQTFLARPESWVETIDRFRGTVTVAPNFAYEICQRRAGERRLPPLDLSCWRLALNGAEPVSAATIERFCRRFEAHGFRREAMLPVYGLAENTLAVTFPALGRGPRVDRVRRDALLARGVAEPAAAGDDALSFVACGLPLEGVELRLVDEAGAERREREVGRVQFRGTSATEGYYRDEEATRRLRDGDWIDSGDLGYQVAGELFLTGRSRDIVIHAGRNISPHCLEEAAGDIEGIRKGCVAVFGVDDPALGTERLVVVAETRVRDAAGRRELVAAVNRAATRVVGSTPDDVCLVAPHTLLKTSSGKIRRLACRELYIGGDLGASRGAVWRRTIATVGALGAGALRRVWRTVPAALYSAYLWSVAGVLLTVAWLGVALVPGLARRHALVGAVCRAFFRLAGVPITVRGQEELARAARHGCVVVANHASYLDPMVLSAALPPPLSFVAKGAFERWAPSRVLMRRLGTSFVGERGRSDARRALEPWTARLERGEVVVVFAEGTFGRAPGLRPFRLGAFEAAARAARPVVPLTIVGTRELLRDEQLWFRRGPLRVEIGPPCRAAGVDLAAIAALRDTVRGEILRHLEEPDLAWGAARPERDEPASPRGPRLVEGAG